MTHITAGGHLVTLINVFTVDPAKQDALVALLTRATDETIRHMPGFVSANIHKSVDGTRVTNYAQWRSREDLEAMLHHPAAMPHLNEATALATTIDPQIYDVVEVVGGHDGTPVPYRLAIGATAAGALALGACATGALAIGRLAIGAMTLKRGRVRSLAIEDVTIGRLGVRELVIDRG